MNFNETDGFSKDLKRLSKKYKSLPDDLFEFKKVISKLPLGSGKHFAILRDYEQLKILKARLFCRYLKGASLRIIYAYNGQDCPIYRNRYRESITTVDFIELYFKGNKENEDSERIKEYLKNC